MAADEPALGRIDYASFSQQTLMEMVVENIEDVERICGTRDDPLEIAEWGGVDCDEKGDVLRIDWSNEALKGSINWRWLPSTLVRIEIGFCELSGALDLPRLPAGLRQMLIYDANLTGPIDLSQLPAKLVELSFCINSLSGPIDLTRLPRCLERLILALNEFTANPTKGHLSVVGWTSTPVLGEAKNLFKPLVVFLSWRRPY